MGEPFLLRALLAGLGLAVVAAPLGCFVVWRRMAYYGRVVALEIFGKDVCVQKGFDHRLA